MLAATQLISSGEKFKRHGCLTRIQVINWYGKNPAAEESMEGNGDGDGDGLERTTMR